MKFLILILTFVAMTANAGVVSVKYTDGVGNEQNYTSHQCVLHDYDTPDILLRTSFEADEYINTQDDYYFDVGCVSWFIPTELGDIPNTLMFVNDTNVYLCLTETFEYTNDAAFFIQLDCTSELNP